MPKISERLETIVSLVPQGAFAADVGSDHGYVPIALLNRGICPQVQAIENKRGPYSRLCRAIDREVDDPSKAICSLSDGVSDLSDGVDTVILAGMGGLLIADILGAHPERLAHVKTIIIDAHSERPEALKALFALGYRLEEERFVPDRYLIDRFEKGEETRQWDDLTLEFGPLAAERKAPAWRAFILAAIDRREALIVRELPEEKRSILKKEITELKELL